MNLIELFDTLSAPEHGNEKRFNAVSIPEYPSFRIAMDSGRNPVLLLETINEKDISLKNYRLKYLRLIQNVDCKITENNKTTFETFTVITFVSSDKPLQEYFLRVSETFIKSFKNRPTQQQILETLNKFIEIFRSLTNLPTKTVQGLWAELFLIDICRTPLTLINYWHNAPEDKFDFDSGIEKIEVKSTSSFVRVHNFSNEQLNPLNDVQILIASVFVSPSDIGKNIQDLINSISEKLSDEFELKFKLNSLVCRTLGNSFEESIKIKFDRNIAKNSLRFYKHQDIRKIELGFIPAEVTDVKYKSDLTKVKPINISRLPFKGKLFNGI